MLAKAEKYTFYLLLFCLPFGTRKLIYSFTDLGPIGEEFTNVYLYFTDLLVGFLLVFAFLRWRQNRKEILKQKKISAPEIFFSLLLIVGGVSLVKTPYPALGFYKLCRLGLFFLFFLYLKNNLSCYNLGILARIVLASAFFQALLGGLQFFRQQDLGLRLLGESPLGAEIAGVAKFLVGGQKLIRSYGTLPHPNILASFLVCGFFVSLGLYFYESKKEKLFGIKKGIFFILLFFVIWGVGVTFSRAVILAAGLVLFWFIFYFQKKFDGGSVRLWQLVGFVVVVGLGFLIVFSPQVKSRLDIEAQDQEISLRGEYNQVAWSALRENPISGIGVGGFVPFSSAQFSSFWKYQPVHNVYLLVACQFGALGGILFLFFIAALFKEVSLKKNLLTKGVCLSLLFFFVLMMGVDHFFWTIQQGQMLFWLVAGAAANQRL